jgi:protocatechuate 3,4-dioxygenase beta subunit
MKMQIRSIGILLFILLLGFSQAFPASFSGMVTDALTNQGIENVEVVAVGTTNPAGGDSLFYSTYTMSDGSYQIDSVQAGNYYVFTNHPYYQRAMQGPFSIGTNTQNVTLDFQLYPNNIQINYVEGHVIDSQTMNPISGAQVYLAMGGAIQLQTLSGPDGSYHFENIQQGVYILSADANGYQTYVHNSVLNIDPNTQIPDLNIFMIPVSGGGNATLSGTVLDSALGLPVFPAKIELLGVNPQTGDSLFYRTDNMPGGNYFIGNIVPATYMLTCFSPAYQPLVIPNLNIAAGNTTLDLYLVPGGTVNFGLITGTVTFDTSGSPVPGALIEFQPLGPGQPVHTVSDAQGNYQAFLPPRDYYVGCYVQLPGTNTVYVEYYDDVQQINQATPVSVTQNDTVSGIDFGIPDTFPPGAASLSGFVFETDSVPGGAIPVYPAIISLFTYDPITGDSVLYRTVNNPDGSYLIENINPGLYDATCFADGYNPQYISNFNIIQGQYNLDFHLTPIAPQPTGSITGTVVFDSSGSPVVGAILEFISNNYMARQALTDSLGQYSADVPAGDYFVSCTYANSAISYFYREYYDDVQLISQATPVSVTENGVTTGIDFGIPDSTFFGTPTITGKVTDSNMNPLENALVIFRSREPGFNGDSILYSGFTDAQGQYSVDLTPTIFPLGAYIGSAQKPGFKIEFWQEKPAIYLADPIFAFGDTLVENINFTLDSLGTPSNNYISGTVTEDGSGIPLQGAFVVGSNMNTGQIVFSFSDAQGDYLLSNLDPAPYILLFAADGHIPEFYDDALIWENATPVFVNGPVTQIDAGLAPITQAAGNAFVTGQIRDLGGTPLSGVLLSIKDATGKVIGYDFSDNQGDYQISGIVNGEYTVQASKVTYTSAAQNIQYIPGGGTTILVNFDLTQTPVTIGGKNDAVLPKEISLLPNYPNPFNPSTSIGFTLPKTQHARLVIYNILGQEIRELADKNFTAGVHQVIWDGRDNSGQKVSSGIYFYGLKAGETKIYRKLLLSK